jgi:sugar O-acyltransferase, sialic acid O-acetyltransferase NeuD family
MHKYYIYGAGGHAKVVASCIRLSGNEIAGFVEDSPSACRFLGMPVLTPEELPETCAVILAFGNCRRRLELSELLHNGKRTFPSVIHPSAQIASDVQIGEGCYIGALANIDPGCRIGDFCIINNSAIVCHDSKLDSGCHICPGTAIAGGVHIGARAWIGLGSRVIEGKSIGADALVGAGSVVVSSIPESSLAYGLPARVIKKMESRHD